MTSAFDAAAEPVLGPPSGFTGWESADEMFELLRKSAKDIADRMAAEEIAVGHADDGVVVVIGVDGFLRDLEFSPWTRRRLSTAEVVGLVLATIREAEQAAAERRQELTATAVDAG